MKSKFYIEYHDKFPEVIRHEIIKAKDMQDAERKWYNKHPYTLIRKIRMV